MKIIDLLNKIANGEEVPKKIKYREIIWTFEENTYLRTDLSPNFNDSFRKYLLGFYNFNILNDEVEILEEEKKIPKKIKVPEIDDIKNERICFAEYKINEIIDYLDYLKSKGDE